MTALIGMVARRDGVDVGEVVESYRDPFVSLDERAEPVTHPGIGFHMVAVLAGDGRVVREKESALTFHPAPTPMQGQAVPACILEAIGDADGWDDGMCAVYIRNSLESLEAVRAALGMEGKAMGAVLERIRLHQKLVREIVGGIVDPERALVRARQAQDLIDADVRCLGAIVDVLDLPVSTSNEAIIEAVRRLAEGKREPSAPEMTSDPPPPAPEGEERWYLLEQSKSGEFNHVVVMAGGWDVVGEGQEPDREYLGTGGFADWQEMAYRRSRHPVLPPLWASDAWTTEPLPEAFCSVWYGLATDDGPVPIEVNPLGWRAWSRQGPGPLVQRLPAMRRTVSPIERPEWAGTAPAGGEA